MTTECEGCGKAVSLRDELCEQCQADWERSRERWRTAPPEWNHLTWGYILSGDAFIAKAGQRIGFSEWKRILEVGPGYGRLLKACLDHGIPFAHYCGLDLSEGNCRYLRERFPMGNVSFVQGDAADASLDASFDIVLSSLTFKHLFPSIEPSLRNLYPQLALGAELCIDLLEGTARRFDGVTYSRWYTREELLEIIHRVGLEHVAFDEVQHDPEHIRLLMVARKPPG